MDDHLARRFGLGSGFGRGPCDESDSIHDITEPVVPPRDHPFGKDHDRPAGFRQELGRGLEGFTIQALPKDTEGPRAAEEPALHAALHEQMPARHGIKRLAQFGPE